MSTRLILVFCTMAVLPFASHAALDRKTCLAGAAAYVRIHEARVLGRPKELAVSFIMEEGRKIDLDEQKLLPKAQKWVDLLYSAPAALLPEPTFIRDRRDAHCSRYPE
jgi:hypothetical protein